MLFECFRTWALEIGDHTRFCFNKRAISYCGLCADDPSSADKTMRMLISKQHNKDIQRVLIEAAKLALRQSPELAMIRAHVEERGSQPGHIGRSEEDGLLHVGVERPQQDFVPTGERAPTAAA